MTGALTSSSRNLCTLATSIVSSNENLRTANLCTAISRPPLDLVYVEVMKKLHKRDEEGTKYECSCETANRYLLQCSHRIVGMHIDVQEIHPRRRVHAELPRLNVSREHFDPDGLSVVAFPRKSRRRRTGRLKTSDIRFCSSMVIP
ncbi:hypothetical protein V1523DRAFT_421264 [Lipomyces doorenjongii]